MAIRWKTKRFGALSVWRSRLGRTIAPSMFVGLVLLPAIASADPPKAVRSTASAWQHESFKATSSREAQEDAIQSIPMDKLEPADRARVAAVLGNVTLFRRLPIDVMPCDPDLYMFLLEHPDVVVDIWQVLGISRITLTQTGPGEFRLTDDAGTTGSLRVLYHDQNTQVIFTDGSYNGPILGRQLQGRILIVLKSGYIWRPDGRCYVTTRLDSFTQLDNIGVEIITKTIQPLLGKTADINFLQTTSFVASLSRTAEVNHAGLVRLAKRLPQVDPTVRNQFVQIIEQIGQKDSTPPNLAIQTPTAVAEQPRATATR